MVKLLIFLTIPLIAADYGTSDGQKLPDPKVTPGVVRTTNKVEICAKTFRTGPFRKTTASEKKKVCAEYGVVNCPDDQKMEIDHLLPLELGGLDAIKDLWVQPAPAFHWKDILENTLKAEVCKTGEITLKEAQECIVSNWVTCYKKHVGALPK